MMNGSPDRTPLSIAQDDALIEIHFNRIPEGPLSNRLAQLEPGDAIEIATPPHGFMVLDEVPAGHTLWLFATGTAIGPYLSILAEAGVWQRFEQVRLVYGTRLVSELCYRDRLDQLQLQHAEQFRWLACVSREATAGCLPGRITDLLSNGVLEQRFGDELNGTGVQVMLCGNPAMIEEMQVLLDARGLHKNLRRKPGQVTIERYW